MDNLQKKFQLAVDLYKSRKLNEAEKLCRFLIDSNPKMVIFYNLLGLILVDLKKTEEAIKIYNKGIDIEPKFSIIYNNLGSLYKSLNDLNNAEACYKKSIEVNNKIPEPFNNLGNLYKLLDRHEDSIKSYEKAISIDPKFYWSHYNLGIENITLGNFIEAEKNLKKTIQINKYFCSAHRTLSRLRKYKLEDEHLNQMLEIYNENKLNNFQRAELAFALGKAHEDVNDYENSFKYYEDGNKLYKRKINFSISNEKDEFSKIKQIFNNKLFIDAEKKGNENKSPIFILGMPRSGTTLVEQIVSSHPEVYGGDELNFIPMLIEQNREELFFGKINIDNIKNIGQNYIDYIKKISKGHKRITDKLPINFKWIGFIKLILPNAKIIHCHRNPKDNIFSIYKNYFTNTKVNFAYNLNDIISYYKIYNDLMIFWKKLFPDEIINANYEKIIRDPSNEIKRIVKSCDLSWSDNCLFFYKNKRPVKTASDIQARSNIYDKSIDSWKNYEKQLDIYFKDLNA